MFCFAFFIYNHLRLHAFFGICNQSERENMSYFKTFEIDYTIFGLVHSSLIYFALFELYIHKEK